MVERSRGQQAEGRDEVEGFFDDLFEVPDEFAGLMAGLDRDIVLERSLLWRAMTARGCGLAPDAAAERELRDRLTSSDLLAARTPSVWGSMLGNLANRAERSGCGPSAAGATPPALLAGAVGNEAFHAVIGRLADHRNPTKATAVAAGWLTERIAVAEGLDETPASVALWAIADVLGNLDVWVHSICDAAADGRPDVAAAGLAGLVLAFPPDSEPIGDLDVWLAGLAGEAVDATPVLRFEALDGYTGARDALGARRADVGAVAGTHGWLSTGWAVGALVVETAVEAAVRHGQHTETTLRALLARWPVLTAAAA